MDVTGPAGVLAGANTQLAATAWDRSDIASRQHPPAGLPWRRSAACPRCPTRTWRDLRFPTCCSCQAMLEAGAGHPEVVSWLVVRLFFEPAANAQGWPYEPEAAAAGSPSTSTG